MTLIGIATYGNTAEFITDTLAYMGNVEELGKATKSTTLTHIDTAIITQGDHKFGAVATMRLVQASTVTPDLDGLVRVTPDILRDVWHDLPASGRTSPETFWGIFGGTIFLVGYSPEASEFRAYSFAFDRSDFGAELLGGPHVMPAPFTVAPSAIELQRCSDDEGLSPVLRDAVQNHWTRRPNLAPPRNRAQWVQLAKDCREQRALDSSRLRTLVGGQVHHTRLGRGKVSTHVLHTFNDSGQELQQMVGWTHHPQAQLAACWCDSGRTWRECHLVEALEYPCGCGSKKTFEDCHAVSVGSTANEVTEPEHVSI